MYEEENFIIVKLRTFDGYSVELSVCKQAHFKNVCNTRQFLDVSHCKFQMAEILFYKF